MTAQTALRDILGPAARAHGYKGSAPTWRKSSDLGDWAIVNVQSSSSSTAQAVRCIVNLAFAPEPWLRWEAERLGAAMPRQVSESLGLYRDRIDAERVDPRSEQWWDLVDDESAEHVVTDMTHRLERDGWPILESMFDRDTLVERLRAGDLGHIKKPHSDGKTTRALALMLMDDGMSAELEAHLEEALDVQPLQREHAERFAAWVRAQAAGA